MSASGHTGGEVVVKVDRHPVLAGLDLEEHLVAEEGTGVAEEGTALQWIIGVVGG